MKATYIDHMGTDLSVVNAAKVSFGKRSEWEYEYDTDEGVSQAPAYKFSPSLLNKNRKVLSKKDQSLIAFLARGCTSGDWENIKQSLCDLDGTYDWECFNMEEILNHIRKMPSHWSPFAHTAITLHLKMPIFVARQIMKHTTGIEYNEVSRRYVDSEPEFYVPDVWRKKAEDVKQGSSDESVDEIVVQGWMRSLPEHLKDSMDVSDAYDSVMQETVMCLYKDMLHAGVAPEQARMVLPQSMYTEVIATGNLYAWANLYIQRTDSHAQKETQDLANQIGEIIKPLYPVSWEALTK